MRHHKDLIEIAKFLDHVNKSFSNLCDHQGSIVSAYNSLAEIWSDKVYSITGEALCETAGTTEQAYNAFYDVCARLQKQHEILCEYQEIDEARHYGKISFPKNFVWEDTVLNNGKMIVEASDIEAFEHALADYLDSLEQEMTRIQQEYENVGDSWADNQYVQLGEELEEFCRNTARQIESLEQLGNLLERKRIKILESEDLA